MRKDEIRHGNLFMEYRPATPQLPLTHRVLGFDGECIIVGEHFVAEDTGGTVGHGDAKAVKVATKVPYEHAVGINLDENKLLRMGFQGIDEDGLMEHAQCTEFRLQCRTFEEGTYDILLNRKPTGIYVRLVHELQNKFYYLTSEELQVDL